MTIRTMNLRQVDAVSAQGNAWGSDPPCLVFETYGDGEVSHRIKIYMRPVDIEELGRRLWEIRDKYAKALSDMDAVLNRSTHNG
jgi:hypothetical protein